MGKKSLIKSTTKKKTGAKEGEEKATKTSASKKAAPKSAKKPAAKKTKKAAAKTPKKAAPKKATTKKTAAPKKTAAAKKTAKAKPKAAAKKTKSTKKIAIKDLLFKTFEPTQMAPEQLPAPKLTISNVSAPPLIDSSDPKEVKRLRALLFNTFNMDDIKTAAKEPEPKPQPSPKPKKAQAPKTVSIKELVFKKFEPTKAAPEQMTAPKTAVATPSAPPMIVSSDPKEVERLRALLFNKFDMAEIKVAAKAPAPKPDKAAPTAEALPTAEPESVKAEFQPPSNGQPTGDNAYITMEADGTDGGGEAMSLPVKIAVAVAVTVVFLLLALSYNNSSKYYIHPKEDAIEIWKGRFSPKDTRFYMTLEGVEYPGPFKDVYAKTDVYPLILEYYLDKADALLEVPGLPDFERIKDHLLEAKDYIVTDETKTAVNTRLNNIERMTLLYKADVAISRNTEDSLDSAVDLLRKADRLTTSTALSEEIANKIEMAKEKKAAVKAEAIKQAEEAEAQEAAEKENPEALKAAPEKIKEEIKPAPAAPETKSH